MAEVILASPEVTGDRPLPILAAGTALVLVVLSLIHGYWAVAGGPGTGIVPEVDGAPAFHPSATATWAVAAALAIAGLGEQYLIAQNHPDNADAPGRWTRIDWMWGQFDRIRGDRGAGDPGISSGNRPATPGLGQWAMNPPRPSLQRASHFELRTSDRAGIEPHLTTTMDGRRTHTPAIFSVISDIP